MAYNAKKKITILAPFSRALVVCIYLTRTRCTWSVASCAQAKTHRQRNDKINTYISRSVFTLIQKRHTKGNPRRSFLIIYAELHPTGGMNFGFCRYNLPSLVSHTFVVLAYGHYTVDSLLALRFFSLIGGGGFEHAKE